MNIYIKIRFALQCLHNRISQTFHPGSIRIPRKNTIQILFIFLANTAATFLKFSSTDSFYNNHAAIDFFRLQTLCKFYGSLNSHMLPCMNCCRNQNRFPRITSTDHSIRKSKLPSSKLQKTIFLSSWCSHKRTLHIILRIILSRLQLFTIPVISRFFHSTNHKHRRRMIIQLLLLTPHSVPDSCINCHTRKPILLQKLPVPGWSVNRRKRHL